MNHYLMHPQDALLLQSRVVTRHDHYTWNNSWKYLIAQKIVCRVSIIFWRRQNGTLIGNQKTDRWLPQNTNFWDADPGRSWKRILMTFEILWDPKAISQLRKLPSDVSSRIVKPEVPSWKNCNDSIFSHSLYYDTWIVRILCVMMQENATEVSIFLSLWKNFSHKGSFVTCLHCGNRAQVPFNYVIQFFHTNVI